MMSRKKIDFREHKQNVFTAGANIMDTIRNAALKGPFKEDGVTPASIIRIVINIQIE
jgi:hypothetical protein